MKKIICFIFALIMAFALTACGSEDLRQRISDFEKQIGNQSGKIADLENQIEQQKDKIAELDSELERSKTDDLVLTVIVDSIVVKKGDKISVCANLQNKSGKAYNVAYRGSYIGWRINYWLDEVDPPPPQPWKLMYLGRDAAIQKIYSILVEDQEPGVYELYVSALFYNVLDWDMSNKETWLETEENTVYISADKIAIIVQ